MMNTTTIDYYLTLANLLDIELKAFISLNEISLTKKVEAQECTILYHQKDRLLYKLSLNDIRFFLDEKLENQALTLIATYLYNKVMESFTNPFPIYAYQNYTTPITTYTFPITSTSYTVPTTGTTTGWTTNPFVYYYTTPFTTT